MDQYLMIKAIYDQSPLDLVNQRLKSFRKPEHHQKCNHLFLRPLSTFAENSIKTQTFQVLLLPIRQTDKRRLSHNLLAGGSYYFIHIFISQAA